MKGNEMNTLSRPVLRTSTVAAWVVSWMKLAPYYTIIGVV